MVKKNLVLNITYSKKKRKEFPSWSPLQHLPKYHLRSKQFVVHQYDCLVTEPSHWQGLVSSSTLAEPSYSGGGAVAGPRRGGKLRATSRLCVGWQRASAGRQVPRTSCRDFATSLDAPHHGRRAKRRSSLLLKITWKPVFLFALCQVCVQLSHTVTKKLRFQ